MKEVILKLVTAGMVGLLLYVSVGCDGNKRVRKVKKIQSSSELAESSQNKTDDSSQETEKKTSSVGIADAADYATGATHLKAKKRTEKRLKDIYSTRNKELEKELQK